MHFHNAHTTANDLHNERIYMEWSEKWNKNSVAIVAIVNQWRRVGLCRLLLIPNSNQMIRSNETKIEVIQAIKRCYVWINLAPIEIKNKNAYSSELKFNQKRGGNGFSCS